MANNHAKKASMEWASLKKEASVFPIYSMRKAWHVLEKEIYGMPNADRKNKNESVLPGKIEIGNLTVLDPRLGNLIHRLEYTRLSIESIQSPPTVIILEYIQACERVHRIINNYRKLAS